MNTQNEIKQFNKQVEHAENNSTINLDSIVEDLKKSLEQYKQSNDKGYFLHKLESAGQDATYLRIKVFHDRNNRSKK